MFNHTEYMKKWRKENPEKMAKARKTYLKKNPWVKTFIKILSRCNNISHRYCKKGIKNYLTIKDLKQLWFRDKAFNLKKPSIDRIDNDGNYEFSNCRFIELSENSRLGNLGNHNRRGKYKKI